LVRELRVSAWGECGSEREQEREGEGAGEGEGEREREREREREASARQSGREANRRAGRGSASTFEENIADFPTRQLGVLDLADHPHLLLRDSASS